MGRADRLFDPSLVLKGKKASLDQSYFLRIKLLELLKNSGFWQKKMDLLFFLTGGFY